VPQAYAFGVDFRQGLDKADRVANIINLLERNQAPLSSLAAAESSIIKRQGYKTSLDENFGVVAQNERTNTSEAMTQYDSRPALTGL
jgi:hypothetical protein